MDKRSKENFKASLNVQKRVSDGIDANAFRKPRQATQLSKQTLKESKKILKFGGQTTGSLKLVQVYKLLQPKRNILKQKLIKMLLKWFLKKQRNLIQHERLIKRKAMPRIKSSKQQSIA